MAISQVGTPATPAVVTGTGTVTTTTAWSGTQTTAAGDLLVAVVTAFGSTSAAATAQASGTSGWTKIWEAAETKCVVAFWTKTAAGSDAAPQFTSSIAGTASRTIVTATLYQLHDSGGSTPGVDTHGLNSGTSGTLTVTTLASVAAGGEYALAAQLANKGSTGSNTWGTSGSWTNEFTDGLSGFAHFVFAILSGPTSGSTLSYAPTHTITSTDTSGVVVVFMPGAVPGAATLSAAGSLTAAGTLGATASLAGAASLATAVTEAAPAVLAGAGSLAAAAAQGATASLGGAGSLSAPAALGAAATLPAAGLLTA